jgi:hypothetical protein
MGKLGSAAVPRRIDIAEEVFEADSSYDWHYRGEQLRQARAIYILQGIVRHQERASIQKQTSRSRAPADQANRVRSVSVLGARLREIRSASLDVNESRLLRQPGRNRLKPSTTFVRFPTPRDLEGGLCLFEQRTKPLRHEIFVEENDVVVGGVPLSPDEPRLGRDVRP